MDEYLEKMFADAFKREIDQEENIVRSLPFFATALGVAVAAFTQLATRLPPFKIAFLELFIYAGLAVEAAIMLVIFRHLFEATKATEYHYPPPEPEMLIYADELNESHRAAGLSPEDAAMTTVTELRRFNLQAFAEAAHHNRLQTVRKTVARTKALSLLILLLALALPLAGAIFIERQMQHHERGERHEDRTQRGDGALQSAGGCQRQVIVAGHTPENAVDRSGVAAPGREGCGRADRAEEGRSMSRAPSDGSSKTPPAAPAVKPTAPAMQVVKKNEGRLGQDGKPKPKADR